MKSFKVIFFLKLQLKNEKTFRDLGSGFVMKQKDFFCDQRGEGET